MGDGGGGTAMSEPNGSETNIDRRDLLRGAAALVAGGVALAAQTRGAAQADEQALAVDADDQVVGDPVRDAGEEGDADSRLDGRRRGRLGGR